MRKKIRRLLGCRRRGRGWRSNRSGARGGVGRAGLWDHKISKRILESRPPIKKVTTIRDLESKLERYRGTLLIQGEDLIKSKCGVFCKKYKKVLSTGEFSKKYEFCHHVKLSKRTKRKLE